MSIEKDLSKIEIGIRNIIPLLKEINVRLNMINHNLIKEGDNTLTLSFSSNEGQEGQEDQE